MFIRQAELFDGLSGMEQTYKAGDLIFREGDEGRFFYMLEDGKVDLFIGKQEEARFLVYYPGEIFGWSALIATHRYLAAARCVGTQLSRGYPYPLLTRY